MRADADISALVDTIYDAAVDPSRWGTALTNLARALQADASSIVVQDRLTQTFWNIDTGSQIVLAQAYDGWTAINPLWPPTLAARAGAVLVDPVVAAHDAYARSKGLSSGESHFSSCYPLTLISVAAVKVLHDPSASGVVTAARGRFTAPFAADDLSLLLSLAPHLQRAIQMNQRVAKLEGDRAGLTEALEHSPQGVLLLDSRARILFANRAAEAILREGDGLRAAPDGLHAAFARDTAALRRLVAQGGQVDHGSVGFLAIKRPAPRRPLLLSIAPLRAGVDWLLNPAGRAMVFVADPDVLPEISAEQIRWLYGLTPAEAAVALAVLRGEGVRAIADGLGISVATARTHLHRIFEKTGTERQAELVRLILNSRVLLKRAEPAAAVAPDAARTVTSPARDSARRIIARPSGARLANGEWPARLR